MGTYRDAAAFSTAFPLRRGERRHRRRVGGRHVAWRHDGPTDRGDPRGGAIEQRLRVWAEYGIALVLGAAIGAGVMTSELRWALGLPLVFAFACGVFRWPKFTVFAVMFWLPVLALARRALLLFVPWTSTDPFLLLAPTVAVLYVAVHPAFAKPWNTLTRLVVIVLGVSALEAVSPLGAGEAANIAGGLFIVVPLLWYFVGRQLPEGTVDTILRWLPLIAVPIAIYGVSAIFIGFQPWDKLWIQIEGARYAALYVSAGAVRPFGTFASAAEYEAFLYIAALVSFGLAVKSHGSARLMYGLLTPLLWFSGFLSGSRTDTVFSLVAMVVVWAYADAERRRSRLLGAGIVLAAGYTLLVFGQHFGTLAGPIGAFVQHQAQGLSHPFNSRDSTALRHVGMLWQGLAYGFRHPFGDGLGIVTLAGATLGKASLDIEVDFANMFAAGGLIAGIAYMVTAGVILGRAFATRAHRTAEYVLPGILLILLFNWLNGQYYFLCPFLWLTIGNTLGKSRSVPTSTEQRLVNEPPVLRGVPS